jgi:CheY-specific phosphatase CheX
MTLPFPLAPYREGIAEVVSSVFETLLHFVPRPVTAPDAAADSPLTAAVYYAGAWKGALLLECSGRQAADWTTRFMGLEAPVAMDDTCDGLGELTNVIAGNLKPLLPTGVGVSLPSVVEGRNYSLRICGGNLSETLYFEDDFGRFRITLVEVVAAESSCHDATPPTVAGLSEL